MAYLINVLLVPVYYLAIIAFLGKKKAKKAFFIVVTLHAIVFRAIADPYVYSDTERYAEVFQTIAEMSFNDAVLSINQFTEWGPGYLALNWLIARFSRDPMVLFIVLSILSVGGVMLFYYKTSDTPLITVMLYLLYPMMYVMGFFVVRQHLAVVFALWAMYYSNNLKISLPLVLIGVSMHFATVIVLPYFFIRNISIRKLSVGKLLLYIVLSMMVFMTTIGYVLQYSERYSSVYEKTGSQHNIVPVILIGSLILAFIASGVFKKALTEHNAQIVRFLVYGLMVAVFGTTVPSAGRLTLYFIYAFPVGMSVLLTNDNNARTISTLYSLGVFLFVILLIYISTSDVYNIYRTIL